MKLTFIESTKTWLKRDAKIVDFLVTNVQAHLKKEPPKRLPKRKWLKSLTTMMNITQLPFQDLKFRQGLWKGQRPVIGP